MDFSLTTLYVVPVGNSLPTTGSTEDLTNGQFGVFKNRSRDAATAANIAASSFIQFGQGRPDAYLGTKVSDYIKSSKVKKWYVVYGNATAANEIWQFSNFTAKCDQDVTLTLRGHSQYLDTISFNGFTRSVTIKTPCCDCGESPCTEVANETLIDLFLEKIAQEEAVQNTPNKLTISTFWRFSKQGTGANAILVVESKPITRYGKFCDVALNPFEYDRIYFRGWVYNNPDTTVDFMVYDRCEQAATATLVQRSSYPRGTSDQVYQAQVDYHSYQATFKHLFRLSQYNQQFEDWVTDGQVYDQLVLQFDEMDQDDSFTANLKQDERVIIYVPTSLTAGLLTVLDPYLGAPTDESGAAITTTTSTSTSSTSSTTSTTTLIP
jgi:hypothetical protein